VLRRASPDAARAVPMTRKVKQSVGIIGLGIIGSRVAANLRKNGFHVWLWNRSPRPEPNFLSSPQEVADAANIIQIFVTDGAALLQVVDSIALSLGPGHIVMNHATVSPTDCREAARRVRDVGARFLDAPFTGSRNAAADGMLVYFIGGDAATLRDARPVLEASSKAVVEIGEIGDACAVKIATNLLVGGTVEILAESLAVLERAGVSPSKFGVALEHHAARSGLTDLKLPAILEGNFEPHFSTKNLFKDIRLALEIAGGDSADLPGAEAVAGCLMSALSRGYGDEDMSSMSRLFRAEIGSVIGGSATPPPPNSPPPSASGSNPSGGPGSEASPATAIGSLS